MKLLEMVCISCHHLGPKGCQKDPRPMWHDSEGLDVRTYWCSYGEWWDPELGMFIARTEVDEE